MERTRWHCLSLSGAGGQKQPAQPEACSASWAGLLSPEPRWPETHPDTGLAVSSSL